MIPDDPAAFCDYLFGPTYAGARYAYPHRMSVRGTSIPGHLFAECGACPLTVYSRDQEELIDMALAHAERHKQMQR